MLFSQCNRQGQHPQGFGHTCACVCACTYTPLHNTNLPTHARPHVCVRTHACTHMHTHPPTHPPTGTRAHMHTRPSTHPHASLRVHTQLRFLTPMQEPQMPSGGRLAIAPTHFASNGVPPTPVQPPQRRSTSCRRCSPRSACCPHSAGTPRPVSNNNVFFFCTHSSTYPSIHLYLPIFHVPIHLCI